MMVVVEAGDAGRTAGIYMMMVIVEIGDSAGASDA